MLMILVLAMISLAGCDLVRGSSEVVGTTSNSHPPQTPWESLVFILPLHLSRLGSMCATHSMYFCLDKLWTEPLHVVDVDTAQAQHPEDSWFNQVFNVEYEESSREGDLASEFQRLVSSGGAFRDYNIISKRMYREQECCDSQNKDYVQYGFRNRLMSPSEYLRRLTDFSETADSSTERHLNYIEV
ncbi:uncharacterized protein LOC134845129 isoform X2 [Symsagittifera roscoffensis]|uniref:uncharacterized protein LOC134845129 isoform X2 n=1 Tax=Symsagittifera roscoffensis TaxID=84072 RepID=UPI00307B1C83